VLVAEPPRRHGLERQFLNVGLTQNPSPAPSGAGFVFAGFILAPGLGRQFVSVTFLAYSVSQCKSAFDVTPISSSGQNVIQIS
jgi:hypothetical protein